MLLVPVCIFRYPASSLLLPASLPCILLPSACLSFHVLPFEMAVSAICSELLPYEVFYMITEMPQHFFS